MCFYSVKKIKIVYPISSVQYPAGIIKLLETAMHSNGIIMMTMIMMMMMMIMISICMCIISERNSPDLVKR